MKKFAKFSAFMVAAMFAATSFTSCGDDDPVDILGVDEVIDVAIDLLENGSKFPVEVVWQANFVQGKGIYKTLSTSYSTMYFCY